ncbi:MAG: hypothetical protein WCS37_05120 [Chloroflexota bacterium]|nr:hypothetical protein [Chloroflexota bacterium]
MVGKEAQITLIRESVASLWQDGNPLPILLHFYGMRGIGKTSLLKALETKIEAQPPGSGLMTLFLAPLNPVHSSSLNEVAQFRSLEEIDAFFNDLYLQFQAVAGRSPTKKYNLIEYERLLSNRSHLKDEDGLWLRAKTLASDLLRLHREEQLHVLLLHDNVPPKVFQWLSKFFFKDLLVERSLCVVATGYATPVVSTLSLVQFFKSQPLLPLLPEEARQMLAPYHLSFELENQLVELAAGHPASLIEGATEVAALAQQQGWFEETGLLNHAGQARVTSAMANRLLLNLPVTLAKCCRLIAPLRSFRYDTLAALLPKLMPDDPKYGRANVVDYMLLGKELNDQIDFIESDKTYLMSSMARLILSNALKFADTTSSSMYRLVNEEAAKYYAGLAERLEKPEQRGDVILEEIYHRFILIHLEVAVGNSNLEAEVAQLARLLQQRLPLLGGLEGNRRLATALETDRDFQRLFPQEVEGLLQMLYESQLH